MGYRENVLDHVDSDHPTRHGIPMQVHHLLSKSAAKDFKSQLEAYGYDINKRENLVALPCTFAGACHLGVQLHRGDHTSVFVSVPDDDDNHHVSYHFHVKRLIVKALKKIERECSKTDTNEIQTIMNRKSQKVLNDIKQFRISLTRVHDFFESEGVGCNGLGKKDGKFSIDDLYKSTKDKTNCCDRVHSEFRSFPKIKYELVVGK